MQQQDIDATMFLCFHITVMIVLCHVFITWLYLADPSMIGVEDQGKKLQSMLNDKKSFQTEFLVSEINT